MSTYKIVTDSACDLPKAMLQELDVTDACVRVNDRGALDCVIRARVETAVLRGKGEV